jgi:hypothetical protein
METMIRAGFLAAAAMLVGCGAAHAEDHDWDDIFAPYRQRIDSATTSSGNAHNVNSATQIITPWPRNVHDRRIPGDGSRMVGAVKSYREPLAASDAAPLRTQPPQAQTPAVRAGQTGGADATQAGTAAPSDQPRL